MFNNCLLFSLLKAPSHSPRISAVVGLMCALFLVNPSPLFAEALTGRPIKLKVLITTQQSVTAETTPIPLDDPGEDNLPLGEPEPIIVGTALVSLYDRVPPGPGPLGEPEPIIVGNALLAFYQRQPAAETQTVDPGPLGEPEPIIVGTVLIAFDQQGQTVEDLIGEGVALFAQANEIGGTVVVNAKKYGTRLLWRGGDFWTDRDLMIIVASTHPRNAGSG